MGTDHDTPSTDALFAPLQEAALTAYARTLTKGKPPRSPRALVHLAWLSFLAWLGLGHLVTEAHRQAAIAAACPPGRKPKDNEAQTNLLDRIEVVEDGRPGFFVSLALLKSGTVRRSCGQFELSLWGCHVPTTAAAAAVAAGWGVFPETVRSTAGLRFLPPSVVALYLAGNPAALARQNNSSMVVISTNVDPNDPTTERPPRELTEHDGYTPDGHAFEPDSDEPIDGPILTQSDKEELTAMADDLQKHSPMPVCPRCLDVTPGVPAGDPNAPFSGRLAETLCGPCGRALKPAKPARPIEFVVVPPGTFEREAAELRQRIKDLTIGDFVELTSGPHAGRIAGVCSVSGDKPEAQLVGRKVGLQDVVEVPGDAIDLIGEDPDDAQKPSHKKSTKKSKSGAKRKGSKS